MANLPKIIAAVLIENDKRILLRKEVLEDSKEYWVVPGGKVEFGEKIEDAALREIKEETGIEVKITNFIGFHESIHPKYDYHTVIFFFHGKPVDDVRIDDTNTKYFSVDEIKNLNLVESAKWVFEKIGFLKL